MIITLIKVDHSICGGMLTRFGDYIKMEDAVEAIEAFKQEFGEDFATFHIDYKDFEVEEE